MNKKSDINRIEELEATRIRNGYKVGWTYYQALNEGILDEYKHFKKQEQGLVEIAELEKIRITKGFKKGWTYYQAEKKDILDAYHKYFENIKTVVDRKQLLTIELVPQTCWFSNVRSIASHKEWDLIKKTTYKNANYKCEVCGGKGLKHPVECHEKWHYDDIQKIQRLDGLIALCPSCHEVKHFGYANTQGRGDIARKHLSKVNNWTEEKTEQYVIEQFKIWQKRSKYDWTLDISFLRKFNINYQTHERKNTPVITPITNKKEEPVTLEEKAQSNDENSKKTKSNFFSKLIFLIRQFLAKFKF